MEKSQKSQTETRAGKRFALGLGAAFLTVAGAFLSLGFWLGRQGEGPSRSTSPTPSLPSASTSSAPTPPAPVDQDPGNREQASPVVSAPKVLDEEGAAGPEAEDLVLPANAQAPEMDEKPVRLSAQGGSVRAFDPQDPGSLPLGRRSLSDYKHLDERSFLDMHGLEDNKRYAQSVLRLKQHLIGTQREKANAVKACEKLLGSAATLASAPTVEDLGCAYWKVLQLAKKESKSGNVKKSSRKKGGMSAALARVKRNRVRSAADWKAFEGASYYAALSALDFRSFLEAKRTADFALKGPLSGEPQCKSANARAALVRNLEDYLPQKEAFELMTKVTDTLVTCLPPSEEAFEIVHMRMGLLHLERSRFNEAATHLELALQTEDPSEEHRALFWRGFVESLQSVKNGQIQKHENSYWDKLIAEFPLTLHALVADEILGRDPYDRISSRPSPFVSNYAGHKWDRYNTAMFVTGLLIARQEKVAMERWSRYLTDNVKPVDFESGLFLAMAHLHAGNTRSGILTVFSVLRDFGGDKLTPKVLELLYPLRYHAEVIKHSRNVDAALVMSLIRQESSFNFRATSPVGARGLMQVMPATAKSLARGKPLNLYDPAQNIQIGTRYLARLLAAHDNNYVFTLASYNAGPRPVNRWRSRYDDTIPLLFSDLIPYPETRNYVSGLLRNMHWYRSLLDHVAHAKENGPLPWTAKTVAPRPRSFGLTDKASGIQLVVDSSLVEKVEDLSGN